MTCKDVLVESTILGETLTCCSIGKILTSGDLIIWRESAECGDGKGLDRLICDEELAWDWEFEEESFDLVCDFKLDAVTVCA